MRRILVTGSRNWTDVPTLWAVLTTEAQQHGELTIVHGACPTGADRWAHQWIITQHILRNGPHTEEQHPADWNRHGRAAGPIRNRTMINSGIDHCHAFPLGTSTGTYGTIRLAQAAGIPTTTHTPTTSPAE